mmetsp:Transcript_16217/g.18048  ORF Transcript_16217/g.18048 Transcript_16217/m.18048 type:complete len:591 (+) Transcript_16217:29-1801(+)
MTSTQIIFVLLASICLLVHARDEASFQLLGTEFGSTPNGWVDASRKITDGGFKDISSGKAVPIDANGYPMSDCSVVIWDQRPAFAWAPPEDDPKSFAADIGGIYNFVAKGKFDLTVSQGSPKISNLKFDSTTWTTTAQITVPHNTYAPPPGLDHLLVLEFKNTQRNASAPMNSGFSSLKIIQPGYDVNTDQVITDWVMSALAPFDHLRFMGATGTNYQTGYYGDKGHHIFGWEDRCMPSDAYFPYSSLRPGCHGMPWEDVVGVANTAKKDIWINIPVTASGGCTSDDMSLWKDTDSYLNAIDKTSYLYKLALFLKNGNEFTNNKGLDSIRNIYIEHSNEVWNFGFSQYIWNKLAAEDEVKRIPNNPLASGCTDATKCAEIWARRRHAKCVVQIGQYFADVFGDSSLISKIRPVYAEWTIFPQHYNDTLAWVQQTYGPVNKVIWGMAQTHYFGDPDPKTPPNKSVQEIVKAYAQGSIGDSKDTIANVAIAKSYGITLNSYEAGPGMKVGDTYNIGNVIAANRDPGMTAVIVDDITKNYWDLGGAIYNYFSLSGSYSRYGCWGATNDLHHNLTTAKFKALCQVAGTGKCPWM